MTTAMTNTQHPNLREVLAAIRKGVEPYRVIGERFGLRYKQVQYLAEKYDIKRAKGRKPAGDASTPQGSLDHALRGRRDHEFRGPPAHNYVVESHWHTVRTDKGLLRRGFAFDRPEEAEWTNDPSEVVFYPAEAARAAAKLIGNGARLVVGVPRGLGCEFREAK